MPTATTDSLDHQNKIVAQIDAQSGKVPKSILSLMDLTYLERSIHRMLCGWGSQFLEWDDKIALCRHVWDQTQVVRRMRTRIEDFPGVKADNPVSDKLEKLANTVLCAPCFEDAVDGIFQVLSTVLVNAYLDFSQRVHPVHEAPTHEIIQEIVTIKDLQRKWRSDYRRRNPHTIDPDYLKAIEAQLEEVGHLTDPLPVEPGHEAKPVGVGTDFRPLTPRNPAAWQTTELHEKVLEYNSADFTHSIEARRLFWMIGYMRELNLAIAQLRWIYDSPYMPWAFHYDESRHMWDESRHGDSGYSRMKDFGIALEQVGYTYPVAQSHPESEPTEPMSPQELYQELFNICMVAETGHFVVKREAYADFRDGGDLESAEMMLFDIIDETTHVQYGHRWLSELAKHAGIDCSDYEAQGARIRQEHKENGIQKANEFQTLSRDLSDPAFAQYQQFLQSLREQHPLSNEKTCPPRTMRPM